MASPRRAVLRRSGDETAAASAMLNTFFRDARMFSGTIWVQRVAYKIVSNDTTRPKELDLYQTLLRGLAAPEGLTGQPACELLRTPFSGSPTSENAASETVRKGCVG